MTSSFTSSLGLFWFLHRFSFSLFRYAMSLTLSSLLCLSVQYELWSPFPLLPKHVFPYACHPDASALGIFLSILYLSPACFFHSLPSVSSPVFLCFGLHFQNLHSHHWSLRNLFLEAHLPSHSQPYCVCVSALLSVTSSAIHIG